jgi:hypothetical protein
MQSDFTTKYTKIELRHERLFWLQDMAVIESPFVYLVCFVVTMH